MKAHAVLLHTLIALLAISIAACDAGEAGSKKNLGLGLILGGITPIDVGLPTYPGARPYKESGKDSSSSADIDITTPLFGLKVVAMKLESDDEPEKVAAFYKRALAQYGRVLECDDGERTRRNKRHHRSDTKDALDDLTCDPDEPGAHEIVYKAGSDENQRIVAIEPHGNGSLFSLVHVATR